VIDLDSLLDAAAEVAANSYSPYSKYQVGSALLTSDGKVHAGTNVENASYGLTICAERSASCRLVSDGGGEIVGIAVWVDAAEYATPCGACRQVLSELAGPDTPVVMGCSSGARAQTTLGALLPDAFAG